MSKTKKVTKLENGFLIEEYNDKIAFIYNEEDLPLFLASPDLLEACEYALENLKPKGDIKKDFSGHNAMATLSKAINKAKGV